MVYGRLLFNNIKEYTPKWFKTIPYAQTTKPTFKRLPQRISIFNRNPIARTFWMGLRNTFGQFAWSWSLLIFGISFAWYYSMYYPWLAFYNKNNQDRTYASAYAKERAFKKKKEEEERLAEEAEAAESAARGDEDVQDKSEEASEEPAPKIAVKAGQDDQEVDQVAVSGPVGFQSKPITTSASNVVRRNEQSEDAQSDAESKKKQKLAALVQRILQEQEKKKRNIAAKQQKQQQAAEEQQ